MSRFEGTQYKGALREKIATLRREADERRVAREARTHTEQLAVLDTKGERAARERARLLKLIGEDEK